MSWPGRSGLTFHNLENGLCLLRVRAHGHRDLATVVGHAATVSPGEWITASGEWVSDHTHGQQFRARPIRTAAPSSVEGIEKYPGLGMKGASPTRACARSHGKCSAPRHGRSGSEAPAAWRASRPRAVALDARQWRGGLGSTLRPGRQQMSDNHGELAIGLARAASGSGRREPE